LGGELSALGDPRENGTEAVAHSRKLQAAYARVDEELTRVDAELKRLTAQSR
jgi:hypothetical protein